MATATRQRLSHAERREQILACAQELFSERHYGAVSVDAVAEKAGVTRGLLHHHFGTKHDLYVAVVREMFRGDLPMVPEYVRGVTPEERLAESITRWLDAAQRNRGVWLAALGVTGGGQDPEIERILERSRERGVDNVIEVLGLGAKAKSAPHVRALVRAYAALAEAATREWLERERLDRRQVHALLHGALLALVDDVLPALER